MCFCIARNKIGSNACQGEKLTCLRQIYKEMGKWTEVHDTLSNSTKTCIAACNTISYSNIIVGSSSFPDPETFMNTKESCIIALKLVSTCSDARRIYLSARYPNICGYLSWLNEKYSNEFCSNFQWNIEVKDAKNRTFNFLDFKKLLIKYASENTAVVKVYMREPFAEVLIRNVETSYVDFISSVGGLLGLCMGFSFVTVAEVFFYLFVGTGNILSSNLMTNGTGRPRRVNRRLQNMKGTIKVEEGDRF